MVKLTDWERRSMIGGIERNSREASLQSRDEQSLLRAQGRADHGSSSEWLSETRVKWSRFPLGLQRNRYFSAFIVWRNGSSSSAGDKYTATRSKAHVRGRRNRALEYARSYFVQEARDGTTDYCDSTAKVKFCCLRSFLIRAILAFSTALRPICPWYGSRAWQSTHSTARL